MPKVFSLRKPRSKTIFVTGNLPPIKEDGRRNEGKNNVTVDVSIGLPEIGQKRSTSFHTNGSRKRGVGAVDYVELVKKNKQIREMFQRKLGQTVERQKMISGEEGKEYAKKVRERLRKCVKDQNSEFVRNVELLALMQKYCCQMQRFRNIMLSDVAAKKV